MVFGRIAFFIGTGGHLLFHHNGIQIAKGKDEETN
jgi:hypothetical protein